MSVFIARLRFAKICGLQILSVEWQWFWICLFSVWLLLMTLNDHLSTGLVFAFFQVALYFLWPSLLPFPFIYPLKVKLKFAGAERADVYSKHWLKWELIFNSNSFFEIAQTGQIFLLLPVMHELKFLKLIFYAANSFTEYYS